MRERLCIWIAWKLPRQLVYWCVIRVWAATTSGKYGSVEAPAARMNECLNRWEGDGGSHA